MRLSYLHNGNSYNSMTVFGDDPPPLHLPIPMNWFYFLEVAVFQALFWLSHILTSCIFPYSSSSGVGVGRKRCTTCTCQLNDCPEPETMKNRVTNDLYQNHNNIQQIASCSNIFLRTHCLFIRSWCQHYAFVTNSKHINSTPILTLHHQSRLWNNIVMSTLKQHPLTFRCSTASENGSNAIRIPLVILQYIRRWW